MLGADTFPLASLARTEKVYVVPGIRPMTIKDVVAALPTMDVPFRMSYPETATLSVDAIQLKETDVLVVPVTLKPVGTAGGIVSGTPVVCAATAVLRAERFPLASFARTENV
jgi:hypothetical protein